MPNFKDYFNSTTARGRANVAKATYASIAVLYLYSRFRRNKKRSTMETQETNGDLIKPQESAQPQYFQPPGCKCSKDNQSDLAGDKADEMHEAIPPIESKDSSCRPPNSQADNTDIAGSVEKSSESKSHSNGVLFKEENADYKGSSKYDEASQHKENRY